MTKPQSKPMTLTLLAAALLAAAGVFLLYSRYGAETDARRQTVLSRGETVLDALVAGIRAHGRMGPFDDKRLGYVFEELAAAPDILAIELKTQKGDVVAKAGDVALMPAVTARGVLWRKADFVMSIAPSLPGSGPEGGMGPHGPGPQDGMGPHGPGPQDGMGPRGPGAGRGMGMRRGAGSDRGLPPNPGQTPEEAPPPASGPDANRDRPQEPLPGSDIGLLPGPRGWPMMPDPGIAGWEGFPTGPYWLTVILDTHEMRRQMRHDQFQSALAVGIWLLAVAMGTWVLRGRLRQRALETELDRAQERAAQHERLAQLGAGLAHETKNPLGIVRGLAQSIGNTPEADPETRRLARAIIDEADRTVGRVNAFLTLARPQVPAPVPVDLDELVTHLLPLVQPEAEDAHVSFEYRATGLRVLADEDQLRRALLNLLINAVRASAAGGAIAVTAAPVGGAVTVTVTDSGAGIAPEDLAHVTEPYFTRFEGGTGLGLTVVDQIARAHGWTLFIQSEPGRGTQVSLAGLRPVE